MPTQHHEEEVIQTSEKHTVETEYSSRYEELGE